MPRYFFNITQGKGLPKFWGRHDRRAEGKTAPYSIAAPKPSAGLWNLG
jgi:hypothetical protein